MNKDSKKRLIAWCMVGVLFLGTVTIPSFLKLNKDSVETVSQEELWLRDIADDVASLSTSYKVVEGGEVRSLMTPLEASTVKETIIVEGKKFLAENQNGITETQIQQLKKYAVDQVVGAKGIDAMTPEQYDNFLFTIDCLVTADTYKAIADRGLVSVKDVNSIRQELEQDIKGFNDSLANLSTQMDNDVSSFNNIVNNMYSDFSNLVKSKQTMTVIQQVQAQSQPSETPSGSTSTQTPVSENTSTSSKEDVPALINKTKDELSSKVDSTKEELQEDIKTSRTEFELKVDGTREELEETIRGVSNELANLSDSVALTEEELQARLDAMQVISDSSKASIIENMNLINGVKTTFSEHQAEYNTLSDNLMALSLSVSDNNESIKNLTDNIIVGLSENQQEVENTFNERIENINSTIEVLQQSIVDAGEVDEELADLANGLTDKLSELEGSLSSAQGNIKGIQDDVLSTKNKIDEKLAALESEKATKEELETALSTTEDSLKTYTDEQLSDSEESLKTYTDEQLSDSKESLKSYTDEQLSDSKESLKSYTDEQLSDSKESLKSYTDEQLSNSEESLKSYTDDKVQEVKDKLITTNWSPDGKTLTITIPKND